MKTKVGRLCTAMALLNLGFYPDSASATEGRLVISNGGKDVPVGADYSTFESLIYLGRSSEVNPEYDSSKPDCYLFQARWEEGGTIRLCFEPGDTPLSVDTLTSDAELLCDVIGRVPLSLRNDLKRVFIYPNINSAWGQYNNIGLEMNDFKRWVNDFSYSAEELVIHEIAHSGFANAMYKDPAWTAAQDADGAFIHPYAENNPYREDITMSIGPWLLVTHRSERSSPETTNRITQTIPNRLALFNKQKFNPYPFNRPSRVKYIDDTAATLKNPTPPSNDSTENAWTKKSANGHFTGSFKKTIVTGASASITFEGAQVTYYGQIGPNGAIADIYIDGKHVSSVDTYSSDYSKFQPIFVSEILPDQQHSISVVHSGTVNPAVNTDQPIITVDAFSYSAANDGIAPSRPTNLTARKGQELVYLNWDDNQDSDFDSFNVYRTYNNGFRALVGPCLKGSFFVDRNLPGDGSYKYEVVALDSWAQESSSRSAELTMNGLPVFEDDVSDAVSFDNNWNASEWDLQRFFNKTTKFTNTVQARVDLSFYGRNVKVFGRKGPDLGIANVYLDGSLVGTADYYSGISESKQVVFELSDLPLGNHTLTLECSDEINPLSSKTKINIDGFEYSAAENYRSPRIYPWYRINDQSWAREENPFTFDAGDKFYTSPNAYKSGGLWFWEGPGNFRKEGKVLFLDGIKPSQAGDYVVTYVNEDSGFQSSYTYEFLVNSLPEIEILPTIQVNNGDWFESSVINVKVGDRLRMGSYSRGYGEWRWTGPNGFSLSTRPNIFDSIQPSDAGQYKLQYFVDGILRGESTYLVNIKNQ